MLYFLPKMLIQNPSYLSYSLLIEWVTFSIKQMNVNRMGYVFYKANEQNGYAFQASFGELNE